MRLVVGGGGPGGVGANLSRCRSVSFVLPSSEVLCPSGAGFVTTSTTDCAARDDVARRFIRGYILSLLRSEICVREWVIKMLYLSLILIIIGFMLPCALSSSVLPEWALTYSGAVPLLLGHVLHAIHDNHRGSRPVSLLCVVAATGAIVLTAYVTAAFDGQGRSMVYGYIFVGFAFLLVPLSAWSVGQIVSRLWRRNARKERG